MTDDSSTDWEDILGTGSVLKQVLEVGERQDQDMEAPRKFFALIDIETRCDGKLVESESYKNFLINSDSDIFPAAHLVIPLMDMNEKSRYLFDAKFCYGPRGNPPYIGPNCKLECIITLKIRAPYDEFLDDLTPSERIMLANRKKDRGKFWFQRGDFQNAIVIYQSLTDLCQPGD